MSCVREEQTARASAALPAAPPLLTPHRPNFVPDNTLTPHTHARHHPSVTFASGPAGNQTACLGAGAGASSARQFTSTSSVRKRCVHVASASGVTCPCRNMRSPARSGKAGHDQRPCSVSGNCGASARARAHLCRRSWRRCRCSSAHRSCRPVPPGPGPRRTRLNQRGWRGAGGRTGGAWVVCGCGASAMSVSILCKRLLQPTPPTARTCGRGGARRYASERGTIYWSNFAARHPAGAARVSAANGRGCGPPLCRSAPWRALWSRPASQIPSPAACTASISKCMR
jgi:hypothetical protein